MEDYKLNFRWSWAFSLLPLIVFLSACFTFFVVFRVFDMEGLAASAFVGLLIGALFAKNYGSYWDAVIRGIGSPTSVSIVVILLVIGIFSKLMAVSGVSQGFVWLADKISINGSAFTAFTFVACALIASATGSSIGTLFTSFPILYPAGILLGSHPGLLAGAILSGAIFGDNLAPISDVTIASAANQTFSTKPGIVDIAGVVKYRLKYALIAGAITTLLFYVLGGGRSIAQGAQEILKNSMNPKGLIMLIPVCVLLAVSIKTRDIFKAATAGIVSGIIIGLASGVFVSADVLSIKDGAITGFVYNGFKGMIGISVFCISLFGILGVLNESGTMNRIVLSLNKSRLSRTPRGTEVIVAIGTMLTTALMGGVTSASVLTFGPVVNEIGSRHLIHPYRRANLLSGFANSIPAIIPFISAFVFIVLLVIEPLRVEYAYIPQISAIDVAIGSFYPIVLFFVLGFSVLSGWDMRYEGSNGELTKDTQKESLAQLSTN